jgi:PAS domain S-box-containing protein
MTLDLERAILHPPCLTVDASAIAALTLLRVEPSLAECGSLEPRNDLVNRIGCVLIVDGTSLIGIITEQDGIRWSLAGRSPTGVSVAEIMSQPRLSVQRSQLADGVATLELFRQHLLQYLPVLDENGQILGVVTPSSLLASLQIPTYATEDVNGCHVSYELNGSYSGLVGRQAELTALFPQSEKLFRALFEEAPIGIAIVHTQNHQLLQTNKQLQQMLGYAANELSSLSLSNIIQLQDEDLQTENLSQTERLTSTPPFTDSWNLPEYCQERTLLTKTGKALWVKLTTSLIHNTDGNLLCGILVAQDISKRKQFETEHQYIEARLLAVTSLQQAILNSTDYSIISTTPEGIIQTFNVGAQTMLCYTADEVIGQVSPALFHDAQEIEQQAKLLSSELDRPISPDFEVFAAKPRLGITTDQEWTYIRKDGSRFPVQLSITALRNPSGKVIGFLEIGKDITRQKQADEQLRQTNEQLTLANAELARATRLKDEFLANMSHELRTPLNAILGMAEGLQETVFGSLTERQQRAIATIERSGRHLLELINDILDLAKIEAGKLDLQISEVSVSSLCDASLVFVRQMALKKQIHLKTDIPEDIGSIQADDRRLRQVLINLLSNAIQFTPAGGTVSLEVKVASGSSVAPLPVIHDGQPEASASPSIYLCFSVTDTGIGIAPENLDKLFQPFMQVDNRLNRQHAGTGLGLALVRQITELHGGYVTVCSQMGQGSCFTIWLPYLSPVAVSADDPHADHLLPTHSIQALVIEDSQVAAAQITRYLEEIKIQTIIHPWGEGVVEAVARLNPALVILDILLPNMSGWEVLTQLKTNPQTSPIPVIIISVVDERRRGLAQGAFEYLVKPITRSQLWNAISKLRPAHHPLAIGLPNGSDETSLKAIAPSAPSILLVEDNQANIETISGYLESRGYQLLLSTQGQEAIDLIQLYTPDLILMDIQMPIMDGLETIRRIRNQNEWKTIPIIALTALAMPDDAKKCLEAGANEYLTKPVKLKQLVVTIQQLLQR